jgi:uncharacterized protein (DUF58 family)
MHRQKDAVGLYTYNDQITAHLPAKCSRMHLLHLFSEICQLKAAGRSDATPCFERIADSVHRRSIIMVFSDFFDPKPDFIRTLQHFQHKRCEVLLFQILDPLETTFPFQGLIEFKDLETNEALEVESELCREDYLNDLNTYTQRMKRICGRMQMNFETMNTGAPFTLALLAYFHKRERMF